MNAVFSELTSVWKDTRLLVLTAQIAAIYAAILIPFKVGIPLIPGFAELRPANAIPIVTSLLFGPPAAWGSAIGNIIGDCFGTLGPASLFGFVGNFLFGYVPYKMWGHLGVLSSGQEPLIRSWKNGLEYGVICVIASAACAGVIAWGVHMLGLLPFTILAPAIFFNNIVMGLALGPPLLVFLYPRVKRWRLRFDDISQHAARYQPALPLKTPGNSAAGPAVNAALPTADSEDLVQIRGLSFRYPDSPRPALHNLSLTISRGEMIALMGRSGSGKSTFCYTLNGLIPQFVSGEFFGSVVVNGCDTTRQPVWKQADSVGFVFQDFETQLISTNVEMELIYPLEQSPHRLSGEERHNRILKTLERVGLAGLNRRDPLTLSGGQRQRLVIASLLVRQPSLLVLDQPMSDVDPVGRQEILALLQDLNREGRTIIWTEQNPEHVLHADRVIILDQGRVCWEGTPDALCSDLSVMKRYGLIPPPITECFALHGLAKLPTTVEEAWEVAVAHQLTLAAPLSVSQDEEPSPQADDQPSTTMLHLDHVGFSYNPGSKALTDVSFSVMPGECLAIVGRNGSGKSTLAQLLNGLLRPTEGRVLVEGLDTRTTPISNLAGVVGYVFQNPDHQIFAPTVWEEVAFGARNAGCPDDECARRVTHALEAVFLDVHTAKTIDPFSLTKGARQRLAVASILAAQPKMLIFDEPSTGLDPEETYRMMEMIRHLNGLGHTILLITHSMELVADYADRCLIMREGHLIADGPTRAIFSNGPLLSSASLHVPSLTRFSQRWGHTLLHVREVQTGLTPKMEKT